MSTIFRALFREFEVFKALPNVCFQKLDTLGLTGETPLEFWFRNVRNASHRWDPWYVSNAIRLAIVFKYGGQYSDSDFITLRKPLVKMNMAWESADQKVLSCLYFVYLQI